MVINVKVIDNLADLAKALAIRREVFVLEQSVPESAEHDANEPIAVHFLAELDDLPVGAARWRFTDDGVKMERFAVLGASRGKRVGTALTRAVLDNIAAHPQSAGQTKYLHAQLLAVPLYKRFGFQQIGELFEECGIVHCKMLLNETLSAGQTYK